MTPQAVPVRPSAWIGRLWGDDDPIFADEAQISAALGAVALRYNALIRDIDRSLERLEAERIPHSLERVARLSTSGDNAWRDSVFKTPREPRLGLQAIVRVPILPADKQAQEPFSFGMVY